MTRKLIYIVGGLIVFLLLISVMLPFFVDVNKFKPQIQSAAQIGLGRPVAIGNIRLAPFFAGVSIQDISIQENPQFGHGNFLAAKGLTVGVKILPLLLSKQIHVTGITIEEPNVTLVRTASGDWNFSSLGQKGATTPRTPSAPSSSGASGAAANVSVQKIQIENGKLVLMQGGPNAKVREYDNVNITASDISFTSQFPFEFSATTPGNGKINLKGKAGPVNPVNAAQTPMQADLKIQGLDLVLSGVVDPASGIAGVLDFTGNVSSDGQQAHSKGTLTANKMKVVAGGSPAGKPVQVDYDVNYQIKPQTGILQQSDAHIGKAVMHLSGTFNNSGATPSISVKVTGANMPISDLQSVLPAVGVTLPSGASLKEGTMNVDLAISGPADKLVTTGPVKLSNAKLAGFNLGEKMGPLAALAGIPSASDTVIQTFSSTIRVAPEGIRTDDMNIVIPSIGSITGSGTVSPDQTLNYQMVAHLSGSKGALSALTIVSSLGQKNGGGIPFKIEGTTSKPRFIPELGGMAGGVAKGSAGAGTEGVQGIGKGLGGLLGGKK